MEMRYSLPRHFSFIHSDIESLCILCCQFVLDSLKDIPELNKFLDRQIAQATDMPIGNNESVSYVDWVFVIHSEERPSASQYRSVVLQLNVTENALSKRRHPHR